MKNITESRFFYRLVMSFSIMIVRNTLVTNSSSTLSGSLDL